MAHLPQRLISAMRRLPRQLSLAARSRFNRLGVTDPDNSVVVSMTTHSTRVDRVHLTIESIGRGDVLPRRLILWLDSEEDYQRASRSRPLLRLQRRGLELRRSTPMGPHSKYYPYVESQAEHVHPLVTADDDILYPSYWLRELVEAHTKRPDVISCFRAHRVALSGAGFGPYASWEKAVGSEPLYSNFLTGVSGVIYPPRFLNFLKLRGEGFRHVAPKADDVWLNANAVDAGHKVALVRGQCISFDVVVGTQRVALWRHNTGANASSSGTENDTQLADAYSATSIEAISAEQDVPS